MYVRDSIICSELKLNCKPEGIESVWVKLVNDKGRGLIVGNIYKPPVSNEQQDRDMCKLIQEVCQKGEIVLMEDFNYPNIDWESNHVVSGKGSEFLEVIQDCFLHQMVNEGTRDTAILDLVFTSDEDKVRDLTTGEHLGESDHRSIRFNINFQSTAICNKRIVPNFKRANFQKIEEAFRGLKEIQSCQQ